MTENDFIFAVKRNNQRLYLLAFSFLKNSADAEDIMQNTFVKLWNYRRLFENDAHMDKWLTAVCVNESRDFLRNPFRKRSVQIDEIVALSQNAETENIDLFKAVMSLPLKERTVVHLFYYEDLSIIQISGILGVKESAVKTRLFRARKRLKMILGDEWINEQ